MATKKLKVAVYVDAELWARFMDILGRQPIPVTLSAWFQSIVRREVEAGEQGEGKG